MIKLPHLDLDAAHLDALATFQAQYDALSAGDARETFWKNKRRALPMKPHVIDALRTMIAPRNRCMYCEDNEVHHVEHFWPRSKYPEVVFAWLNYLYSCGICNGPKNSHFATISATVTVIPVLDVTSPHRCGRPAFINPRYENPMDFLILDIRGDTFRFAEKEGIEPADRARALWTLQHLPINRDGLPDQRRLDYETYIGDIEKYLRYKQQGEVLEANHYGWRILRHRHITVFREMQRQWRKIDRLKPLFEQAPELGAPGFPFVE